MYTNSSFRVIDYYLCIAILQSTEPSEPPQNVRATTTSSTEIMVTWEEVPAIDQNGIIINYEVEYEPLQFMVELSTRTINATDLAVAIVGLEEYVEYNISVRAYTSVGPGPYSDPVTERTDEDGTITFKEIYSMCKINFLYTHRTCNTSPKCPSVCCVFH